MNVTEHQMSINVTEVKWKTTSVNLFRHYIRMLMIKNNNKVKLLENACLIMLQKIKWIDFCIVLINFNMCFFFYIDPIWYLCLANINMSLLLKSLQKLCDWLLLHQRYEISPSLGGARGYLITHGRWRTI